ncbi:phosphotransferase enzyme family-domain-containing protein [Tuber borchii]|uniref:Phosphotransferase enzyme family-domain-containing protein n=1 Tax=Tuber borchii TaxID=42251 RepID=A0A2T7A5A4_TUBBO|nr:phosphotransferase enzyme family-domain-containing protein [Tuber borchii]
MTSTPSHHPSLPFGLRWEYDFWGPVPAWAATPNIATIEALSRQHLGADNLSVEFLAGGAFNKVYSIMIPSNNISDPKSYVFRATLPVEPFYKTASEVATLRLLRQCTSLPVPEVFAYDCTTKNELGFEWIIMEKIPGTRLKDLWPCMNLEQKKIVIERLGQFSKELREKCKFNAIGSLYQRTELSEGDLKVSVATDYNDFVIGPIVNASFFAGKRKPLTKRDRGPYRNDRVYLLALLKVEMEDKKLLLKLTSDKRAAGIQKAKHESLESDETDEDDDAEDAPEILENIQQLLEILPSIFSEDMQTEKFVLHHHDLNRSNIMVDHTTLEITGIIDWECITTVPAWEDTYPKMLLGEDMEEQPDPLVFGETDECRIERWEKWENTKLRKISDQAAGSGANNDKDACDKRGFREQLYLLEFSTKMVKDWIIEYESNKKYK